MNRLLSSLLQGVGALALLAACSSNSETVAATDQTLELYSWWTNPGEIDALKALLDLYESKYPQTNVINATVKDADNARAQLAARMADGSPPDTFQALGGADLRKWVSPDGVSDAQSMLEPLDAIAAESGLLDAVPKDLVDALTIKNKVYGIPIGVHRFNTLYANLKLFEENDQQIPTTLEEFYQVAKVFEEKGIVPLALGSKQPWTLTQIALDGVLVAKGGVDFRASYLTGQEAPDDERMVETLNEVTKLLAYTNDDHDSLTWDQAAQMLIDGEAAMTITGDFAKGFFLSKGLEPGVDLGQGAIPGSVGTFVYVVDCFNLPKGALDRDAAINFLNLVGSTEAQNLFAPIKGATPPRTDADLNRFDNLAQETIKNFRADTLTPSSILQIPSEDFRLEFDTALKQFGNDADIDAMVNMLKNRYDLLH